MDVFAVARGRGGAGERHGRGRRRARASRVRGEARARVRGETGRVSARARSRRGTTRDKTAFRDSDATVRKTLVFLSRQRGRFRRVTRVSTSRVPSWGVSCLFQPQRGRSRAPSPRATSPERSARLNRPRDPRSAFRFVFRALALELETENALARASDARSSAYRPARPTHKVHSGAACVSECVATTLRVAHALRARLPDFAKLSEWRARGAEIVTDGIGERFGRSTR